MTSGSRCRADRDSRPLAAQLRGLLTASARGLHRGIGAARSPGVVIDLAGEKAFIDDVLEAL
jgi:hypothetical protein